MDIVPLLDCCMEESKFHKPLFAAVGLWVSLGRTSPCTFNDSKAFDSMAQHYSLRQRSLLCVCSPM